MGMWSSTANRTVSDFFVASPYATPNEWVAENATLLGATQTHSPVEVFVSRSVPAVSSSSERPFVTVEEAAAVLGISRTLAYNLAREFLTNRSGLPCVRLGSRCIVVPRAAVERWTSADLANPNDAA